MTTAKPMSRPERPRVLIVEDEAIVAEDLADQLAHMGYEICGIADNKGDAIKLVELHAPHVVLMDIVIKGPADGIDVAEHLSHSFQVPVIFATAYSDPATLQRAANAAPYGYITKPYQARDVRAAIEVSLYKNALQSQLKASEQWFAATLKCVADGVVATDMTGKVQFVNVAAERVFAQPQQQLVGRNLQDLLILSDRADHAPYPVRQLLTDGADQSAKIRFDLELTRPGQAPLPVDISAALIRDGGGANLGAVIALRDVSERRAAEAMLRHSEERFRTAFEFAPIGMALVGMDGQFLQGNSALCQLLGCPPDRLSALNQLDMTLEDDREIECVSLRDLLGDSMPCVQFEKRYQSLDGREVPVLASVALLRKNDVPVCYLYQVHDMTQRKAYEANILRLAHFDALTGLANRLRLSEDIERQIIASRRSGEGFALVFCDLDHFKQVNDTLGHQAGDQVLQAVAKRLSGCLRESDVVARLGGDEFVLLLPQATQPHAVSTVLDKVLSQVTQPINVAGSQVRVGVSFGVCMYPGDGVDARSLLKHADSALYAAKAKGRGTMQFYDQDFSREVEQGVRLAADLRRALERHEFVLHFQPIIDLRSGRIAAMEALLRWQHPVLGLMLPYEFIKQAENTGLILQLGAWVVYQACRARAAWRHLETEPIAVCINVSSRQLAQPEFVSELSASIVEHGIAPGEVIVELTEQVLLARSDGHRQVLTALADLGVGVAIDDFGLGYSSLSCIAQSAPDQVKIDRSFMSRFGENARNDTLVESILSLGSRVDVGTVAEGVETKSQLEFLKQRGCDRAQGFLFSRPLCEADVHRLLQERGSFET